MSQQCSWPTHSWPLEGRCPYYALLGLTQAPGFAGGPDSACRNRPSFESLGAQLQLLDLEGVTALEGLQDRLSDTQKDLVPNL